MLKGHHDLAIGNIVGSNILNLLVVLPFPGLLSPGSIEKELFYRDFISVLILTLLLAYFCYRSVEGDYRDQQTQRGNVLVNLLRLVYRDDPSGSAYRRYLRYHAR